MDLSVRETAKPESHAAVNPPSAASYRRRAEALEKEERYDEAASCYRQALELGPGDAAVSHGLTRLYLWRLGRLEDAKAVSVDMIRRTETSASANAGGRSMTAYDSLAQVCLKDASLADARAEMLRLLERSDLHATALHALALVSLRSGRYDDSRALVSELLASDADNPRLMGLMAQIADEYDHDVTRAGEYHERALGIAPSEEFVVMGWLAHLLRVGEPERGHAFLCELMKSDRYAKLRFLGSPLWDGSDPRGKMMILDGSMGFGDGVQFARVATILRDAGASVTVNCKPQLHQLIQSIRGVDRVASSADSRPADWFLYPFCACSLLNCSLASLGERVPYVTAAPDVVTRWKAVVSDGGRPKVGLVWAGNAYNRTNRYTFRSMSFSDVVPLLEAPGIDFYSLQLGAARRELQSSDAAHRVHDLADGQTNFMDMAAIMMAMDLVVSVDTAAAHVAGALGRPTFVLLPYTPSFRWQLNRRDSPWYPTMTIFAQTTPGSWADPVNDVRRVLIDRARAAGAHREVRA